MRYTESHVTDLTIAYIGGGSKGWAWNLMADLALDAQLSGTVRLYDLNHEAALRNESIGNALKNHPGAVGRWTYKAVPSLRAALSGADFVICSILPGTFAEMASDVHEPEKYGIYQSVGDTVGPGGIVRALRVVPMYVEIARAIEAFSPKAWVINYTNPMSLCTRTLSATFPGIKVFGCCHEVFGTQELLAAMLKDMLGLPKVGRHEIKVNVLGINHFTWLDSAGYGGQDLFPLYRAFVDKYFESGFSHDEDEHWMNSYFASRNRVKFDLFRRYGLIAAAGDRHLAEFMPPWYLKDPATVGAWNFNLTPVSWRVERQAELEAKSLRLASGQETMELRASGEEGLLQIKALLGLGDFVTNVNLPNVGQAPDLPPHAVVETNALFGRDQVRPLQAGTLPVPIRALVTRHIHNQETTLAAALAKDADMAFLAFSNDPRIAALDVADARRLFDAMLVNTKAYLPGWNV